MIIARTFMRRSWLGVILILSFLKLGVARIMPTANQSSPSPTRTKPHIKTGRVLRFVVPAGTRDASSAHYGLEATGIFPFVRVVALQQSSAPVPVEVAPVPALMKKQPERFETVSADGQKGKTAHKKRSRPLTRRLQANQEKPFCFPANSQNCLSCPTCCIVCTSCTSTSGCGGCGDCACGP